MTVPPVVAIVALGCVTAVALVVALRAPADQLTRFFKFFNKWFGR